VRDGDVAGVVLLGALEGEGGDEGGRLVAVLVGGDLAPGVGAAGVRARDVVDEGDVDAAGEDEVPGYVLEGGLFEVSGSGRAGNFFVKTAVLKGTGWWSLVGLGERQRVLLR
jgi:hypothetical protein